MEKIKVKDPSNNYALLDTFEQTTRDQIDQKIVQVKQYFKIWSQFSLKKRVQLLQVLHNAFIKHKDDIVHANALEVGVPVTVSRKIDVEPGLAFMQGYLDHAELWLSSEIVYENDIELHTLSYEPRGVAGISIAWNFPFSNFIWGVIQHLLVGNTVIIKHSEHCMLTAKLLEKIMSSIPELSQACQFVYGIGKEVGNYVMHGDVDSLWFIGSTQTGLIVYQAAAKRGIPVVLELGGSAPGIVCEDVNVDEVVQSVYDNRFLNSGQVCDGLKRLIVHENIFDELVEKLIAYTQNKKVGPATEVDTNIGPLVSKQQLSTLQEQVEDAKAKGANILLGGKQPKGLQGAYYEPTIMTNIISDMSVWKEEVFGPVLPVVSFKTIEQAIELANDTEYGLGGYVYCNSFGAVQQICAALKTGNINVNDTSYVIPQVPFGGYKVSSGIGRTNGKLSLQSICNTKVVAIKK